MRRTLLLAMLLVALGVVVTLVQRDRAVSEFRVPALQPTAEPLRDAEPRAPELVATEEQGARIRLPSPERPASVLEAAAYDAPDLVLVHVVEGPAAIPLVDAEVSLQVAGNAAVYGITDAQGTFDFPASEVPAQIGDTVSIVVKDEDGHERARRGLVLAHDVVIRVQSKSLLRGEIALASGESPEWLCVSLWCAARGSRSGENFVGYQNLDASGRFAIPALGEPPPDSVRMQVARTGLPANLRMATTEMLVSPGPRIVISLVRLEIAVVGDDGQPVPEALLRCTAAAGADRASRTERGDGLAIEPSTGMDGRARLWVPSGPMTIVAGSKGFAPARRVLQVDAAALEVVMRLRALGESDRLRGSVEYEDGSFVRDLEVRGWSDDDSGDLASVSTSQARTDGEGRFVLPIATDQDVEARAYDPLSQQAGVAKWRPGDGPVRLVIDRGQALTVRARELPTATNVDAGRIEIVLVKEPREWDSLETDALPVTFDHVPAGRWSVYALARAHDRWARGEAFMTSAAPEEITLDFEAVEHVTGRVQPVPRADRRLFVVFTPSGWSTSAADALLTAEVGADGTFRVAAPGPGELALRSSEGPIERRPAVGGGAPLVFTLRE